MKVYLDNAATTPIHPDVVETMIPILRNGFGNPSSIHAFGREIRSAIENARKKIAQLLNCTPGELFFTSGGTEANNMAIRCSIDQMDIKHAITSPIEHHAVLHTLQHLAHAGKIKLSMVNLDEKGHVDLNHLEELLKNNSRSLVSLMNANNELGVHTDIVAVGEICKKYDAIFHSDTVQTMGHYNFDLKNTHIHFLNCAAHKFHGPKGVGFIYINNAIKIAPFITGGAQERNMRGGTENVYGIVGLAKALEIAYTNLDADVTYIRGLKNYMHDKLVAEIPGIKFNGDVSENSLYTVLNVSFPPSDFSEMLLFNLDIKGIAASGGSACSSGSNVGSHVLSAIKVDPERPSVRFSFSKMNTKDEIDYAVQVVKELYKDVAATA